MSRVKSGKANRAGRVCDQEHFLVGDVGRL
jgi:hypothetical protein